MGMGEPRAIDPALARTVAVDNTWTDAGRGTPGGDLRLGSPDQPEPAAEMGLAAGELLAGRYRVVAFIARGGIGEVYHAHDALLDVPVAVKLLRPELSRKPGAQERFAQEIRLARKITHANVCRVFDVGVDGERVFFTMELHPGETLAGRLRRAGRMDIATATPLVRQLLDGVGAAHASGIVHTDLKPSNVLITRSPDGSRGAADRVVVTDFGLAVPCCATLGCACSMPHLIGTPAYMAPEQVEGGTLVDQTDVFSIGVILFEMLTGALPWTGATAVELAQARLAGTVPCPTHLVADLDPRWAEVIRTCLARDAAARPRSVADLATALGL
jgi:serine/threonine-protein kinase